jgi:hypothetical protein
VKPDRSQRVVPGFVAPSVVDCVNEYDCIRLRQGDGTNVLINQNKRFGEALVTGRLLISTPSRSLGPSIPNSA